MRRVLLFPLSVLAVAALLADAAEAPPGRAPAAAALREGLAALLPAPALGPTQGKPAGDVTIDFAPASKVLAVLAQAQQMEQERNWPAAAALYQRLLDEAPHELCQASPTLYLPIGLHVEERIASFPPEGLAAYRRQVDRHAEALYHEAAASDSPRALAAVAARYLHSSRGDNALDRLATGWLARGHCGRALRAWERVARLCRDSDVDAVAATAKLAICLQRLGRPAAARSLVKGVVARLGRDATVTLAGEATRLSALPSMLAQLRSPAADSQSWPLEGGDGGHARTAPAALRPGAMLWSDGIQSREAVEAALVERPRYDPYGLRSSLRPSVLVSPVVVGGRVVYPTRMGLLARDLATGKVAWGLGWPRQQRGEIMLDPFTLGAFWQGRWACSAGGGRVYCSVPLQAAGRSRERRVGGYLVAADAATGLLAWSRAVPADLPQSMESGWFSSPPLPRGQRLVVGLRAGGSGEEFHLCCFRASDGKRLWRTYVCSRMAEPWYVARYSRQWFGAMPAESSGLAVVCPGGGVVAAAELATGRLRWLARYDQPASRRRTRYLRSGWDSHTPVVADGVVYATPPDSDFVHALALHSGRCLWRVPRGTHRHLVAVRDGRAYLAGTRAACVSPGGELEWQVPLPSPLAGRPVLAGGMLHLPTSDGILYLDAATGGEVARTSWPQWRRSHGPTYDADVASGDLLAAAGKLFVVTPFSLNVFAPRPPVQGLAAAAQATRDDPAACYALGQEFHWQGDTAAAAQLFARALELAGRRPGELPASFAADLRRRLATCYDDLARRHERAGRLAPALDACDQALEHAARPAARAALRMRAAQLARRLRRWPRAVAAYQAILAEAEPHRADWQAARQALDRLLEQAGRQHYEPFERAAAAAMAEGTDSALATLVHRYPTSERAPDALLRLAAMAQAAGRAAHARLRLHRLTRDYPNAAGVPEALYRLAAGYARNGAPAMARGALHLLRARHPRWPTPGLGGLPAAQLDAEAFLAAHGPPRGPEPAGGPTAPLGVAWQVRPGYGSPELHLADARRGGADALFLLAGLSLECRSPDDGALRWADRPGWIGIHITDASRPGGGVLVSSVVRDTPAERAGLRSRDVIVGFDDRPIRGCEELIAICLARRSGADVRLRILRDDEPKLVPVTLGTRPAQHDEPQLGPEALLGATARHVLLRQPSRLDALRLTDGKVAWSFDLGGDPRAARVGPSSAAAPGVVALVDSRSRLVALDPDLGYELWSVPLAEPTVHDVALWEHGLVVASSRPATLRVVNPVDGGVRFAASDRHAAGEPRFGLDSGQRLCYAMGSTVGCYDGLAGRAVWSARIRDFTARRLWASGSQLVAHGVDKRGGEAFECRRATTGEPLWALSLARGETLRRAALEPDAFYVVSRRAGRVLVRRLDSSTGKVAWSHELRRDEQLGDWEPSAPALCLGLTATDAQGRPSAQLVALDKLAGTATQRLELGAGRLAALRRVARSLYAVVEDPPGARPGRFAAPGVPGAVEPRYRVVRIARAP